MRVKLSYYIGLLAGFVGFIQPTQAAIHTPLRPNILFILADDMGYGDVHALNPASAIPTPNLDRLAAEGMVFTDAHTPSAVCTPTRYGLLTGRYCWRSRLKQGVLDGYGTPLIERERPTVAAYLRDQGYVTGIVGKWHLGLEFSKQADGTTFDYASRVTEGPKELGFDYSYVIPASLDFPPYVYIENGRITSSETVLQPASRFPAFLRQGPRAADLEMQDVLDQLLAKAQRFIVDEATRQPQEPFFLYFPLTAPHKPVMPHPRFQGKTSLGPYGDFVAQVDWTVGQVLETLRKENLDQNTLVIYTSDNGSYMYRRDDAQAQDHVDDPTLQAYRADRHRANGDFRGTKADIWEAGHHVPFLVRWPGVVQPRSNCARTICLTDFFATAADILQASPPSGSAPDSFSFLSLLQGQPERFQRPPVIHHSGSGMFAIRDGQWKLVLGNGSGGREAPKGKPFEQPFQLFNLASDPTERSDRWATDRQVAADLETRCQRIRTNEFGYAK